MEQWRELNCLPGYGGIIEVSDLGLLRVRNRKYRLRSKWGTVGEQTKPDIIISGETGTHGYRVAALYVKRKRHRFLVHRLVAMAFVDGYDEKLSVNHINGDKSDNRACNLEWVTLAENTKKQWETGLVDLRGESHPSRKLSSSGVRSIRKLLAQGTSARDIAAACGVSDSTIYMIKKGQRWASVKD